MGRGEVIDSFRGEYRFLSNFYPSSIVVNDLQYPTVEHAYQAAKTEDEGWREAIRSASSPYYAKQLGKEAPIRPNWESMKLEVMNYLLHLKFHIPNLHDRLATTHPAYLEEGNWWGDTYWGVCNGVGENNLGKLLMGLRDELIGEVAK